ncbi:F-box/LRR-repeat protein fbxl-1 [Anabrus simplex]|uniref:F-box/LRR-repeat protein fbxl-1 n=1 Tax=Anabrus simplex TaxID=316456 RepID=UPI0035A36791
MERNPGLLPADVLLKIFSYCSYRDIVKLQFVCRWWQQVSRHKHLWRYIMYKPDTSDTTKDIIGNLKASPELRTLDLSDVECSTVTKELAAEIVNTCPQLKQLSVCWYCLYKKFLFKMKIKILILEHHEYDFDVDVEDYFEHLHNCFPNVEHLDCSELNFEAKNFCKYLRKKGHSFHTLGFCCGESPGRHLFKNCRLPYLSVCPNLKSLTLFDLCYEVGRLPVESVEHLKQISSLTIRQSLLDDANTYLSVFKYFPNLVGLELDKCILEKEQGLLIIANNCPLLEKLTLSSVRICDEDLRYVPNFKKLTFLCLNGNHNITDACVTHLQAILELRYLDIRICHGLTPQCLLVLCSFAKLQTLKFDLLNRDPPADFGSSHVKNPDLHIMLYTCKDMKVLDRLRSQRLRISFLKGFPYYGF